MDIGCLSTEVLISIFLYLNLKDTLSCSTVCKRWKNVIDNCSAIWKNFYHRKFRIKKCNPRLLNRQSVTPVMSCSPNVSVDYTKVYDSCEWRLTFIQEMLLEVNWRKGNYESFPLPELLGNNISFEDNVLVFLLQLEHAIAVFDTACQPCFIEHLPLCRGYYIVFFKLSGGKLVICQGKMVHVYEWVKRNKKFNLHLRFICDKSEEDATNVPQIRDITRWFDENNTFESKFDFHSKYDHDGHYFAAVIQRENKHILHVWNLNTRRKTIERELPYSNIVDSLDMNICFSNIYLIATFKDGSSSILCYSLSLCELSSFNINWSDGLLSTIFSEKLIISSDRSEKNFMLWNRADGTLLHKESCLFRITQDGLSLSSGLLVVKGQIRLDSRCRVKIFELETFETLYEYVFCGDINFIMKLIAFNNDLALFSYSEKIVVWDNVSKKRLYTVKKGSCCRWISPCCTKMLIQDKGGSQFHLVCFW